MKILKSKNYILTPKSEKENAQIFDCTWIISSKEDNKELGTISFAGEPIKGQLELKSDITDINAYKETIKVITNKCLETKNIYSVKTVVDSKDEERQNIIYLYNYRFEEEKDNMKTYIAYRSESLWLPIGLCLGSSISLCFGIAIGSYGIGFLIGLPLFTLIGAVLDINEKKNKEKITK